MTRSSPRPPLGSSSNVAVALDGLGKKFRLTHDRNWTLKATMLAGHRTRYEEFWALRHELFWESRDRIDAITQARGACKELGDLDGTVGVCVEQITEGLDRAASVAEHRPALADVEARAKEAIIGLV